MSRIPYFLILTLLLAGAADAAEPFCYRKLLKIAVIDTGFGKASPPMFGRHLCNSEHKDFTGVPFNEKNLSSFRTSVPVPPDLHGHGTNVVGLIDGYASASGADFCIVILRFYTPEPNAHGNNLESEINAIKYATKIHADIVNISGGGMDFDKDEVDAVKDYIDHGGTLVAAAGNEYSNLSSDPKDANHYYPAQSDSRVIVVGSKDNNGNRMKSSNSGPRVNVWEYGFDQAANGIIMSGTSQATAITTGKIAGRLSKVCEKK